jgi:hypothetical protein
VTLPMLDALPAVSQSRGSDPTLLRDELRHIIADAITNHPRSLQAAIGPSGIGTPCTRKLAHRLLNTPEVSTRPPAWKPTVGHAIHTWLEDAIRASNDPGETRYLTELRVCIGQIGGVDITGNLDLYDRCTFTVVDWKSVGPSRLKHYRSKGPGQEYRVQIHSYG